LGLNWEEKKKEKQNPKGPKPKVKAAKKTIR